MKIAVVGAGAIGCYFGGLLAGVGHAVTLIGRAPHIDAIRRDGLRLQSADFDRRVPVATSETPDGVRDAEIILCCVKRPDTVAAAKAMAPFLRPDAVVVSLQNGVDNRDVLCANLPDGVEVIPAAVYAAVAMAGAGHVRHLGGGQVTLGTSASSDRVAVLLTETGASVDMSTNIDAVLWTKLIINCAFNALSAITAAPYGVLIQSEGIEAVLRDVVDECLAVAARAGVAVGNDVWARVMRIPTAMPDQLSSTAQDLRRGRRSEIDHLNGFIVARGADLGVATPVNRTLWVLVKAAEARNAR